MEEREFYSYILARVIQEGGVGIVIGGEDSGVLIREMVKERCCKTLKMIRDVLDDHTATDEECFQRIEQIVRIYEELGPGAGSRHDFG